MTDITMCKNVDCAIRETCYRFLAEPSEYQAYFVINKVVNTEDNCNHYWKCLTEEERKEWNRQWRDY